MRAVRMIGQLRIKARRFCSLCRFLDSGFTGFVNIDCNPSLSIHLRLLAGRPNPRKCRRKSSFSFMQSLFSYLAQVLHRVSIKIQGKARNCHSTECSMLVLSRKACEQIQIGEEVVVTILQVKGQTVRIGIEAPRSVRVLRSELPKFAAEPQPSAVEQKSAASPAKPKPQVQNRTARGSHLRQYAQVTSSPLSNRFDLLRSPQRMEASVVRFDAAVRSTSLPR